MRGCRGFTLIEVILALGLSTLVLMVLAMAIHVQLRASERGRRGVEEAQLARAILHRIAQDLRGLVRYKPTDLTTLVTTTSSSSSSSSSGSSSGSSGSSSASSGSSSGSSSSSSSSSSGSSDSSDSSSDSDSSDTLVPMLVGTLNRLEVDVSHVPATGQFQDLQAAVEMSGGMDRASETRTVAYFMAEEGSGMVNLTGQSRHGLVRCDLDRSVARWASEQGQLAQMEQDLEPIAPEVTAVEFRYYDGTDWQETWDSQEQESLPLAVEITLMIVRTQPKAGLFGSLGLSRTDSTTSTDSVVYRLIVQLPAAEQTSSSEESTSSTEDSSSTDSEATDG